MIGGVRLDEKKNVRDQFAEVKTRLGLRSMGRLKSRKVRTTRSSRVTSVDSIRNCSSTSSVVSPATRARSTSRRSAMEFSGFLISCATPPGEAVDGGQPPR